MIDAKIIIEIPLPIPCSVMSSPSHIKMIEPAVIAVTERAQSLAVGTNSVAMFALRVD